MFGYVIEGLERGQTVWVVLGSPEFKDCPTCEGTGRVAAEPKGVTYCPVCYSEHPFNMTGSVPTGREVFRAVETTIEGWCFTGSNEIDDEDELVFKKSNLILCDGDSLGGGFPEADVFTDQAEAEAEATKRTPAQP